MGEIQKEVTSILSFLSVYKVSILFTLLIVVAQVSVLKILLPKIEDNIEQSRLKPESLSKARKSAIAITVGISFSLITFVWGFDIKGLMTVSASAIALLGVALFAGWSIISNVTAFFLLIFHQSFKRGNFVRIISGENYIEGYIAEINLFNTRLISETKEIIIYPNTQLILNPAVINPKARYSVVGKIVEFAPEKTMTQ